MKKILLILICLFVSFEVKSQIKDGDIYSCITTNVIGVIDHKVVTFDTLKFNVFVDSERLLIINGDEETEFKNKVVYSKIQLYKLKSEESLRSLLKYSFDNEVNLSDNIKPEDFSSYFDSR